MNKRYQKIQKKALRDFFSKEKILEKLPNKERALKNFLYFESLHKDSLPHVDGSQDGLEFWRQLLLLFSNSIALSWMVMQRPALLEKCLPIKKESAAMFKQRLDALYEKFCDKLAKQTENEKRDLAFSQDENLLALRIFKLEEFIHMSLSDYLKWDSFRETIAKISYFADICIKKAFVASGLAGENICILGMGKLGGQELNYSSDIDIMFISAEDTPMRDKKILRKIRNFIDLLDAKNYGFPVFLVDLDIRPEGSSGELYLSLPACRAYYETRASIWERLALLKGRCIVGPARLTAEVELLRKKVVYQKNVSSNDMLVNIFNMKNSIEESLRLKHRQKDPARQLLKHLSVLERNVKLGTGGIRDIEFSLQFLQLHHSRFSNLPDDKSSLTSLDTLLRYNILRRREYELLEKNYIFLRRVEHILQLKDLKSIRELPLGFPELRTLVSILDYPRVHARTVKLFMEEHSLARFHTRRIFNSIFRATALLLRKIEKVEKILEESLKSSSEDNEGPLKTLAFLQEHVAKLESDYFLSFSAQGILKHVNVLSKLSLQKPLHAEVSLNKDSMSLEVAALDCLGAFSIISGVVSSFGINILEGKSFAYVKVQADAAEREKNFYRRPSALSLVGRTPFLQAQRNKPMKSKGLSLHEKQDKPDIFLMCLMKGRFKSKKFAKNFSSLLFQEKLTTLLGLQLTKKESHVREALFLATLPLMKKNSSAQFVKHIQITIDNDSHVLYTILDIKSEDSFLFLYHFTQSLSARNFNIAKLWFSTKDSAIENHFYITEKNGSKVQNPQRLQEIKTTILLLKHFSYFLVFAPNPRLAFEQFVKLIPTLTENAEKTFNRFFGGGPLPKKLASLLGTSSYMFEDFFHSQSMNLMNYLAKSQFIDKPYSKEELLRLSGEAMRPKKELKKTAIDMTTQLKGLNQFKDQQLFRIDMRFLGGRQKVFEKFCLELSLLADVILARAYKILERAMLKKYSLEKAPGHVALLALGKWGGMEMGYSSDIEIMFVYQPFFSDEPATSFVSSNAQDDTAQLLAAQKTLPAKQDKEAQRLEIQKAHDFFAEIGRNFPKAIQSKKNGIFELDFRLRPDGEGSKIAVSLNRFAEYYTVANKHVMSYERMALIRLRAIYGNKKLVRKLYLLRDDFLLSPKPFDVEEGLRLRKAQIAKNCVKGKINLKFSPGGLADLEYFVQKMIMLHGRKDKWIVHPNTLEALKRLLAIGVFDEALYKKLRWTYKFFRNIINALRIVRGNALDMEVPEPGSFEYEYFLRRLLFLKMIKKQADFLPWLRYAMDFIASKSPLYA